MPWEDVATLLGAHSTCEGLAPIKWRTTEPSAKGGGVDLIQ